VEEGEPAGGVGRIGQAALAPVRRECSFLHLDRGVVLALEVKRLAQAVERLACFAL
jgi:hypothetical protein